MRALLFVSVLLLSSAGCASDVADSVAIQTASDAWRTNAASQRGQSGLYHVDCPAAPSSSATVWGTNPYTDDSSVCWAGVHAGVIAPESGGRVVFEPRPGASQYAGSTQNGVTTRSYGTWGGGFYVVP